MSKFESIQNTEQLAASWTRAQLVVRSYIASVVRNVADAEDVLQEVALAIARQYADSDKDRAFILHSMGIGHRVTGRVLTTPVPEALRRQGLLGPRLRAMTCNIAIRYCDTGSI